MEALGLDATAMDVLAGVVGEGAAIEFLGFCESSLREEQVRRRSWNQPTTADLPATWAACTPWSATSPPGARTGTS